MPSTAGVRAGNAFVVIRALDQTSTGLQTIERKLTQFGQNLTNIGVGLAGRGVALLAPVTYAANQFIKYEDAMKKVEAKSAGTVEDMMAIRKQARELGLTTALTADQIGQLQHILAQKGYNRKEIYEMTKGIVDLARASGDGNDLMNDGIQAATGVSGVLRAYQMDATNATRVADLFAAAVDGSNMSLEEMIVAMSYAAPTGAEFGVPIEEVMAITSAMRDLNIDASIAGTAFRNMVLYMSEAKETEKFNKTLSELTGNTIEFTDAAGNLHSPLKLLLAIQQATEGLGTAERSNLLSEMFGTRATVPAGAVGRASKTVARLLNMFQNADGLAAARASKTESGLGGSWRLFKAVVNEVAVAVGAALAGPLNKLSKWTREHLGDLAAWIAKNEGWVASITLGVAAVTGFGLALVGAGIAVKTMSLAVSLAIIGTKTLTIAVNGAILAYSLLTMVAGLAMAAINSSWALPVAGVFLFVAALIWALGTWDDIVKTYSTGIGKLVQEFKDMGATIIKTFSMIAMALGEGDFELAFKALTAGLKLLWVQAWTSMGRAVEGIFVDTATAIQTVFNMLLHGIRETMKVIQAWGVTQLKFQAGLFAGLGMTGTAKKFSDAAALAENMDILPGDIDWGGSLDQMQKDGDAKRKKALKDAKGDFDAVDMEINKKRQKRLDKEVEAGKEASNDDWRLRERAKALIKQGPQGPQISPKALEATNSRSVEAMKEFQENRYNASEGLATQMLKEMKTQTEILIQIDEEIRGNDVDINDVIGVV